MEKLGLHNRTELVRFALRRGVDPRRSLTVRALAGAISPAPHGLGDGCGPPLGRTAHPESRTGRFREHSTRGPILALASAVPWSPREGRSGPGRGEECEVLFTSAPEPGWWSSPPGPGLPLPWFTWPARLGRRPRVRRSSMRCPLGLGIADLGRIVQASAPDVVCVSAATAGIPGRHGASAGGLGARVHHGGRRNPRLVHVLRVPSRRGRWTSRWSGKGEETLPELLAASRPGTTRRGWPGWPSRWAGG